MFFDIPFDLHGLDCGAPDCYETNISFYFELNSSLDFPSILKIKEHEYGCSFDKDNIDKTEFNDFKLQEITKNGIIYSSTENKTLIIMNESPYAYFFNGLDSEKISFENVYKIIKEMVGVDETFYPYQSTILRRNYYEYFEENINVEVEKELPIKKEYSPSNATQTEEWKRELDSIINNEIKKNKFEKKTEKLESSFGKLK